MEVGLHGKQESAGSTPVFGSTPLLHHTRGRIPSSLYDAERVMVHVGSNPMALTYAVRARLVVRHLAKVEVASSNLVCRSIDSHARESEW